MKALQVRRRPSQNKVSAFIPRNRNIVIRETNKRLGFGPIHYIRVHIGRSRWSLGLRHEPSSPARTLGSWVRIPLEAWMSVCVYSVCALLCVGSGLATSWSPPSKESYRPCIGLRNCKSCQDPKGCRAIERQREQYIHNYDTVTTYQ
jgi:hypothetical protein